MPKRTEADLTFSALRQSPVCIHCGQVVMLIAGVVYHASDDCEKQDDLDGENEDEAPIATRVRDYPSADEIRDVEAWREEERAVFDSLNEDERGFLDYEEYPAQFVADDDATGHKEAA